MFANLTKFGQSAAQKAAKLAESVGQLSKIQAEYDIAAEVGYAGPGGIWKIHRARRKRCNDGERIISVNLLLCTCPEAEKVYAMSASGRAQPA